MLCRGARDRVILIRKNRPDFQKGKWNGIGGKLEANESPLDAMVREFREETGIVTQPTDWQLTLSMTGAADDANTKQGFCVWYYRTFVSVFPTIQQTTDELVNIKYVDELYDTPTLDNMKWILPLQLTSNLTFPLHLDWVR
jgi:8-oxo-dGTP diphosphatase